MKFMFLIIIFLTCFMCHSYEINDVFFGKFFKFEESGDELQCEMEIADKSYFNEFINKIIKQTLIKVDGCGEKFTIKMQDSNSLYIKDNHIKVTEKNNGEKRKLHFFNSYQILPETACENCPRQYVEVGGDISELNGKYMVIIRKQVKESYDGKIFSYPEMKIFTCGIMLKTED